MNRLLYTALQKSLCFQQLERPLALNAITPNFVRPLAIYSCLLQQETNATTTKRTNTPTQKKFKASPKITLIAANQAMSVTSFEEAQKLAKRRDLQLLQVQQFDSKTQRPVYKLATVAEMLADEMDEMKKRNKSAASDKGNTAQKKSEKSLTIGSRISEHDLGSRLKNISKWLVKQHEVRILLQGNSEDMTNCDNIVKTIEQSIKEPQVIGKITQKRTKGRVIKFNIVPVAATTPDVPAAPKEAASA